jgi:hypothetical protein
MTLFLRLQEFLLPRLGKFFLNLKNIIILLFSNNAVVLEKIIKRTFFIIHLILSILILLLSSVWMINDILIDTTTTNDTFFWFACPVWILIPLGILALVYLRANPRKKYLYIPIILNLITFVLGLSLYFYQKTIPDYGFQRLFSYYSSAVQLIEHDNLVGDEYGYLVLPDEYRNALSAESVFISRDKQELMVYFMDDYDNSDGYSWGYIYNSENNRPEINDDCWIWREIIPSMTNWYYCDIYTNYRIDN